MKKSAWPFVSAGIFLALVLSGCQPGTPAVNDPAAAVQEAIVGNLGLSQEEGLESVTVSAKEDGLRIVIALTEPVTLDGFGSWAVLCASATERAVSSLEGQALSQLKVDYMEGEDILVAWATQDLSDGFFYDNRRDPSLVTAMSLADVAEHGVGNAKFNQYLFDHSITLTASDVQYNMSNNVGKEFSLVGTAKRSDYYNYGFNSSIESSYFCMSVTPTGGSYTDNWYIYCHRDSFKELFDDLQAGSVAVNAVCVIPSSRYKSSQGNMAELKYVVW